jgi:hypothetical protein
MKQVSISVQTVQLTWQSQHQLNQSYKRKMWRNFHYRTLFKCTRTLNVILELWPSISERLALSRKISFIFLAVLVLECISNPITPANKPLFKTIPIKRDQNAFWCKWSLQITVSFSQQSFVVISKRVLFSQAPLVFSCEWVLLNTKWNLICLLPPQGTSGTSGLCAQITVQWAPCTKHSPVGSVHTTQSSGLREHNTVQWAPCTQHSPVGSVHRSQSSGLRAQITVQWAPCTEHSPVGSLHTTQSSGLRA